MEEANRGDWRSSPGIYRPAAHSNPATKDLAQQHRMAEGLDPQILFGSSYKGHLERLKWSEQMNESRAVAILDMYHFKDGESMPPAIESLKLSETQLLGRISGSEWLSEDEGMNATGGFRLIMGPTTRIMPESLPETFPEDINNIPLGRIDSDGRRPLPFSRSVFESIVAEFHLPTVTPWVFATNEPQFQRHSIYARKSAPYIGYTMRRPTRGILPMNVALSISHDPRTGISSALLLGCSDIQQAFIREQIKTLAGLASHPLLLPVLLSAHQEQLLNREKDRLWVDLLEVETASGQTGAPAIEIYRRSTDSQDYASITKGVLGVIQLASSWEMRTKELILGLEAIQESLDHLSTITPETRKATMQDTSDVLSEWLRNISHKASVLVCELEYIEKRAQAQMTAVYNYIAQIEAQYSREISTYSTQLAADSQQISVASKRDSSAMKGIAVLTMVFLPGTFIATFFAMPIFDFTGPSRPQVREPGFWMYWIVTIPLTTIVLGAYLIYLLWIQRRNNKEDSKLGRPANPALDVL